MELHDPALAVALFYAGSDKGNEQLWQALGAPAAAADSTLRRQRVMVDGAVVVQAILEREGRQEAAVWQDLYQEMAERLGDLWTNPPGHPWGGSRFYVGTAVAGHYEEQRLLREGLALTGESSWPIAHMPIGRLWLLSPPAMRKQGSTTATYGWIHAPGETARSRLEALLWGDPAPLLRAELYLHRALHSLRQYGQDERAALWEALDRIERTAIAALEQGDDAQAEKDLRSAGRRAMQWLVLLSRRHNLLRSSAYLYQQISSKLCADEGSLFSWYVHRFNEAAVQWSYDLERGDRAVGLAQTALAALPHPAELQVDWEALPAVWPSAAPTAVDQPPEEKLPRESAAEETGPEERPPAEQLPAAPPPREQARVERPHWTAYLIGAAIVALCLVDDSWVIVLARVGVVSLLSLVIWGWFRLRGR